MYNQRLCSQEHRPERELYRYRDTRPFSFEDKTSPHRLLRSRIVGPPQSARLAHYQHMRRISISTRCHCPSAQRHSRPNAAPITHLHRNYRQMLQIVDTLYENSLNTTDAAAAEDGELDSQIPTPSSCLMRVSGQLISTI